MRGYKVTFHGREADGHERDVTLYTGEMDPEMVLDAVCDELPTSGKDGRPIEWKCVEIEPMTMWDTSESDEAYDAMVDC